ncbi:ParB family chromosome partitioning protein [Palleronia aestuarii]|uniref:ParB family chromosome partitioning protein n=1 Tax=Palleronia aestuarii TaxID=568105 RepID=A0A2W7NDS2_9RHOB|nr:plasmid partitioning protein RepB [Palleronia aestuarii]PZX14894.1 ParB family chromosome partitioning protein [Palleronia aestuarii]
MARKNLLAGLVPPAPSDAPETGRTAPPAPPERKAETRRPAYSKGAIGAVGQSIADLKSRSVIEIDPHAIEAGGVTDRLEHDETDHAALMASLETYGQQVPILVRPHPETEGRFQIVYGRRRVLALRDLGLLAKAMVRDLDDAALVMAQGQENTARRDLSFIEKCNFARQMREAGYDRKAICDALSIDKTLISRMFSVVDRVGLPVIETIGAAHGIGRDRWTLLADRMQELGISSEQVADAIPALAEGPTSAERFEGALAAVRKSDAPRAPRRTAGPRTRSTLVKSANGLPVAKVSRKRDAVVLTLPRDGSGGFEEWLVEHLEDFHRQWVTQADAKSSPDKG